MRVGTRRMTGRLVVVAMVAMIMLCVPAGAWSAEVSIAVGAPGSAEVGDTVEVTARVDSEGVALEGALVALSYPVRFAGVQGMVELDRATTDVTGIARLEYVQRAEDNGDMRVEYLGPEPGNVDPFILTIPVVPGGEQQHVPDPGVSIPFLNGTFLVLLITLVWAVVAYAAFQLHLVGRRAEGALTESSMDAKGSAWVGTLFTIAAVITAAGMVVVTFRSPLSRPDVDELAQYDRTPVATLGQEFVYEGLGVEATHAADAATGMRIWVGTGCASCHGLRADGGAVGPQVTRPESLDDFARDLRRGPGDMPVYREAVLTDRQIEILHVWLESGSS